jgi:EmrB/QacA subfamily drug resistance transporter
MRSIDNKKVALIIATTVSFFTPFMGSSINVALPSIGKEFSMDAVLLSWVATSYLLSSAMFLVPFGKIADIYGRKKVFSYGIIIYTLASFLSAVSPSTILLICFRILQGIGNAMIFGISIAILTSVFPIGERGKALGINVASVYLGLSLGPFLGGLLTQHLGWRSIFFMNVFLGIIIIFLVFRNLKGEWAEAKGEKFDFLGSVICGFSLVAVMYGFSLIYNISGILLVLLGILGIVAFVFLEMRLDYPVLNINLFRNNTVFAFSNLAALVNYSATSAVGFLLSLYLQYIKGFSPQYTGIILVSQPIVQVIFSPLAGKLSDRIESRIIASIGMTLTVIGLILLIPLTEKTAIEYIIFSLFILGLGLALFSSPNTNAIMSSVEKRYYGVASATLGTMRLMGQMFSMGLAMLIITIHLGKVQITPEYYSQYLTSIKTTFIIFVVLCFGGIFASISRGKVR